MKLNKLGALFLFTSQGIVMMGAGQEFAGSKVIYNQLGIHDPDKGKMDHNSYNKDNETNYINYKHAELNKELVDYYKGLIEMRKDFEAFRRAEYDDITFSEHPQSEFGLSYLLKFKDERFVVLFNADQSIDLEFDLPEGEWNVIVDKNSAGIKTLYKAEGKFTSEPVTGAVLKLK